MLAGLKSAFDNRESQMDTRHKCLQPGEDKLGYCRDPNHFSDVDLNYAGYQRTHYANEVRIAA